MVGRVRASKLSFYRRNLELALPAMSRCRIPWGHGPVVTSLPPFTAVAHCSPGLV